MKKNNVNKKIKTEVAIGIIVLTSLIFGIVIYRAGSFSAALNYIPMSNDNNKIERGQFLPTLYFKLSIV